MQNPETVMIQISLIVKIVLIIIHVFPNSFTENKGDVLSFPLKIETLTGMEFWSDKI